MHRARRWALASLYIGLVAAVDVASGDAAAGQTAWPGNEDLRHLRLFENPQVSPDGSAVLLQVREPTADGARRHLWLLDPAGGAPRQLTNSPDKDKDGESSARWMPDGRSILFIAHRGEQADVFQLSMLGGEAQKLAIEVPITVDDSRAPDALPPIDAASAGAADTHKPVTTLPVEVKSYDVDASGKWLWVIAADPQTPGEKAQAEAKADANWVDHETHGTHLYLWNLSTHKAVVVPLHDDVAEAAWSPDGTRLVVVTQALHHGSDLEPSRHAWMVSIAHPETPEALGECPREIATPRWDASGRELYFASQSTRDAPPGYPDLFVDELATHRVVNLTDGLDGTPVDNIVPL
ncbi:MAG: TolB family protein, partial [Steroidobacteraceae bacterium]